MDKNLSNSQEEPRANNLGGGSTGSHEFHVTYFDTDCGRIRTEVFDTASEADRFASRNVSDEHCWAVIDALPAQQERLAA